jgi:hypothetical protein
VRLRTKILLGVGIVIAIILIVAFARYGTVDPCSMLRQDVARELGLGEGVLELMLRTAIDDVGVRNLEWTQGNIGRCIQATWVVNTEGLEGLVDYLAERQRRD